MVNFSFKRNGKFKVPFQKSIELGPTLTYANYIMNPGIFEPRYIHHLWHIQNPGIFKSSRVKYL